MRDAFIAALFERAKTDEDIVFLSADYGAPSLDRFRADLPAQFINTAISEQNQIAVAAGLALGGKRVFVYSIASFITTRCYEQLKIDLCAMHLPVTIIGVGACYAYGVDGPTHHATEDIALMRALSGMVIYSPADAVTATALVDAILKRGSSPTYCRFDRGKFTPLSTGESDLREGFTVLRPGTDISIMATGIMVHRALEVAAALQVHGIQAQVIDLYRLKPLSWNLLQWVKHAKRAVTIEEHSLHGGLGSIVAELMADENILLPLKRFAISDASLYAYGERDNLHRERGLDTASIVAAILGWK